MLWSETHNYLSNCKPEIKTTAPALNVKTGFGNWILEFEIYLEFGAWNLGFYQVSQPRFQVSTLVFLTPDT